MGIRITFKLFATLQDYLPDEARKTNSLSLDLDAGATPQAVIDRFRLPVALCHLVLVDGNFIAPDQRAVRLLQDGETLAIWPPVAGG